jgi:hypothetical protein
MPNHPIVLEVSFTEGERVQGAKIYHRIDGHLGFQTTSMECNDERCRTILPPFNKNISRFLYRLKVNFCSGKELESRDIEVTQIPIPEWQTGLNNLQNFITVHSSNSQLNGFISHGVVFENRRESPNLQTKYTDEVIRIEEREDSEKIEIENQEIEVSWWDSLFGDDDESLDIEERDVETTKETLQGNFKEVFTP